MKRHTLVAVTAALAAATAIFIPAARAGNPSSTTDPGFVSETGQINTGHVPQPWSATPALPQDQQPAQEDARAALMMPDDGAPSAGRETTPAPNSSNQSTTGAAPASATTTAAGAGPPGPIGATIQTMPAKFSRRNDLLDHMPLMAWPLPLTEQQRQQIYKAVMADKSEPAVGGEALKPTSSLSFEQVRDMHSLPQAVAGIDGLQGLQYLKGKGRVLLVRPPNGIVVDQIAM